jgi:hypothetical protein
VRSTHIYSGIVISLVSLWCLIWFIPNSTSPAESELDLAPALVPSIAVGVCLLTALIMLISALRASPSAAEIMDEEFGAEASGADRQVMLNMALWVSVSVVSWLLMEYVCFELSMTLFLIVTMLFVGMRSAWTIALIALITPFMLSLLVFHLFDTELPGGLMAELSQFLSARFAS